MRYRKRTVTKIKKILKLDQFKTISEKIKPYANLVFLHKWGEPMMGKYFYNDFNS